MWNSQPRFRSGSWRTRTHFALFGKICNPSSSINEDKARPRIHNAFSVCKASFNLSFCLAPSDLITHIHPSARDGEQLDEHVHGLRCECCSAAEPLPWPWWRVLMLQVMQHGDWFGQDVCEEYFSIDRWSSSGLRIGSQRRRTQVYLVWRPIMWVQEMELPRLQQMSTVKSLAPEPSCWLLCGLNYVFRGGYYVLHIRLEFRLRLFSWRSIKLYLNNTDELEISSSAGLRG